MTKTSSLNIRVDTHTKDQAEIICKELGTNLSNAVNIFLTSFVRYNGFPFELKIQPNEDTIIAMQEARALAKNPNAKKYQTVDELFNELAK